MTLTLTKHLLTLHQSIATCIIHDLKVDWSMFGRYWSRQVSYFYPLPMICLPKSLWILGITIISRHKYDPKLDKTPGGIAPIDTYIHNAWFKSTFKYVWSILEPPDLIFSPHNYDLFTKIAMNFWHRHHFPDINITLNVTKRLETLHQSIATCIIHDLKVDWSMFGRF